MEYIFNVINNNDDFKIQILDEKEEIGYISGKLNNSTLTLEKTFVSEKYNGKGLAKKLVEKAISYAKDNHLKIKPVCSYVEHYFSKHTELNELLEK